MGEITPREPERALEGPKGPEVRVYIKNLMRTLENPAVLNEKACGTNIVLDGDRIEFDRE